MPNFRFRALIRMAAISCSAFGKKPWYRQRISIPASVLIGLTGLFWTLQRVFFF